jgi:hypothetical protein
MKDEDFDDLLEFAIRIIPSDPNVPQMTVGTATSAGSEV